MISKPEASNLVKQIKAEAFRLGFCLFGITTAEPPAGYLVYEQWLDAGLNAGMTYLDSERHRSMRKDPILLLEGARSIIVLGWPYELTHSLSEHPGGMIAGYALQPDYHDRLIPLQEQLVEFIHQIINEPFEVKCVTDSAPLLERELGQRAGLGWIGRNSCLISPTKGSSFLLSEILITLDLPASEPFLPDRCGTCRRCIDACPICCIRANRTLDAGKCISYLTIENKTGIPLELREKMGSWIFGCDICQSVCPWNRRQMQVPKTQSITGNISPQRMIEELVSTPGEFKARHAGSPLLRAKAYGYQRNLIVALANLNAHAALPALRQMLETESQHEQRDLLEWALQELAS